MWIGDVLRLIMDASINNRNCNLDILRIVAALMVLVVHVGYEFPWISDYTWYGFYGTSLFFVLSGYLSMISLDRCSNAVEFYKRRVVRIVPLYWIVLIVNAILNPTLLSLKYLRYFVFLHMFIPSDDFGKWNNINGLWTMSAFVFFYLVAPILYRIIRTYYIGLVLFVVMLFGHNPFVRWFEQIIIRYFPNVSDSYTFAAWHPFSVLYIFIGGIVIYLAVKDRHEFSLALLCMLSMVYNDFRWNSWEIVMIIIVLSAICLPNISMIHLTKIMNVFGIKIMPVRIIETFAAFSFPLYLTHALVLGHIMKLQNVLVPVIRHKGFLVFVIATCLVVGYLSYRFVEKPIVKRISKIISAKDK